MRALTRSASLLRRAALSAPTMAALHQPAPGVGPCLAMACRKHFLTGEEKNTFLTSGDLNATIHDIKMKNERGIYELNHKFNRAFFEQKIGVNMAIQQLKYDMMMDADDKDNKYCLDHAGTKHQLKILGQKFESHKHSINHLITQGKNFGWGVGVFTAVLARLNLPKVLSKKIGK